MYAVRVKGPKKKRIIERFKNGSDCVSSQIILYIIRFA